MSTLRYHADNPARHVPTAELRAILRAELRTADDVRELAKETGIGIEELRRCVMPECPDAEQTQEFLDLIAGAREAAPLQALRERLRDWEADDRSGQDRIAAIERALEAKLRELHVEAPRHAPWQPAMPQWTSPPTPPADRATASSSQTSDGAEAPRPASNGDAGPPVRRGPLDWLR